MFTAAWFKDTLERVIKTVLQAFIASLILSSTDHLTLKRELVIAAIAAGLALLKAVVAVAIPSNISPASWATGRSRYLVDIVERFLFTFVQAFAAALLTDYHISGLRSAALAGIAAALSFLMSLLSLSLPSQTSPASLVPATTATPPPVKV